MLAAPLHILLSLVVQPEIRKRRHEQKSLFHLFPLIEQRSIVVTTIVFDFGQRDQMYPGVLFVLYPLIALHVQQCASWILPVSRLPPVPVPSLPELKATIAQIRNFQYMMDRMEVR